MFTLFTLELEAAIDAILEAIKPTRPVHLVSVPRHSSDLVPATAESIRAIVARYNRYKLINDSALIKRTNNTEALHTISGQRRDPDIQEKTMICGDVEPEDIYIILDDIVTSGASLCACSRLLRKKSVKEIYYLTIGMTCSKSSIEMQQEYEEEKEGGVEYRLKKWASEKYMKIRVKVDKVHYYSRPASYDEKGSWQTRHCAVTLRYEEYDPRNPEKGTLVRFISEEAESLEYIIYKSGVVVELLCSKIVASQKYGWILTVDDIHYLFGVVTVGRPVARMLDDGETCEVTRCCVKEGERNANSRLYGAAVRAAKAMGYRRIVTYTLPEESGSSLRAVGFVPTATVKGRDWNHKGRPRKTLEAAKYPKGDKIRWEMRRGERG